MKKIVSIVFLLTTLLVEGQNFGDFASAIFIDNCGTSQFYNTSGSGANCINPTCATVFHGTNFGSFNQNSGALEIKGGEIKSWKNACCGNVCGARLNFTVYLSGARPGSPIFTTINLPFKCGCGGAMFTDGLGPCGGSDQKWSIETSGPFDLTNRPPGIYTVEIYYDYNGDDGSTSGCGTTKYINNGGNPTNYTASFEVVASGGTCTLLPIELLNFAGECSENLTTITWSTASEINSLYFTIEKSYDGIVWDSLAKFNAEGFSSKNKEYQFSDSSRNTNVISFYRLRQYDYDGKMRFDEILPLKCDSDESIFYTFPNPSSSDFQLILQRKTRPGIYYLNISDINSKQISLSEISLKKGINVVSINEKLVSGIYFITLSNSEQYSETIKHIVY